MGNSGAAGVNGNLAWLPPLVLLADYDGDWNRYLEAVYNFFRQDFIASSPKFDGKKIALKKHPVVDGREATFWHLISEGKLEADRVADFRRCERIRWPRPVIEAVRDGRVACWKNKRQHETRIVIALDDFSYVVVLAQRKGYVVLWTAYCVERQHRRVKLRREYEEATKH